MTTTFIFWNAAIGGVLFVIFGIIAIMEEDKVLARLALADLFIGAITLLIFALYRLIKLSFPNIGYDVFKIGYTTVRIRRKRKQIASARIHKQ